MIKVAAITGGKNVPSARFRVRQLIPSLAKRSIEVHEYVPSIPKYPPPQKLFRPAWITGALVERLSIVPFTFQYDITLLQREMISTLLTLEPLTKKPRVLDVDDAIFMHRGGVFAKKLAQISDLVICGNDFLAEVFSKWNKNVTVIPTAIDTQKFVPVNGNIIHSNPSDFIIGWTGTSGNFRYLYQIEDVLKKILESNPNIKLRIISDKIPEFDYDIIEKRMEFFKWSEKVEVSKIQDIDIGIMPLANTTWEMGKCSFKMLEYMSCGIPVVASPVGMNKKIFSLGKIGFPAKTNKEWIEAIERFVKMGSSKRKEMGMNGRVVVEKYFSIGVIADKLASEFKKFV